MSALLAAHALVALGAGRPQAGRPQAGRPQVRRVATPSTETSSARRGRAVAAQSWSCLPGVAQGRAVARTQVTAPDIEGDRMSRRTPSRTSRRTCRRAFRRTCRPTTWRRASRLASHLQVAVRRRRPGLRLSLGDAGMTTAEYAIGTLAACGFAALLVGILKSGQVKALLLGVITKALALGG